MTNSHPTTKSSFLRMAYPWLVISCGMIFYCYNYFLRVSPSVMQNELTQAFHITAGQFGTLAGFYYWGYTPMQLPAGLIFDKFGVRVVLSLAALIAMLGLSIFISTNLFNIAGLGRFMIGLGCAFAYIGTLKLASLWLPANRFATVAGLTTAIGMIAGALSQKYLVHIINAIGYKQALHGALAVGAILSVVIVTLVRSRPNPKDVAHYKMLPVSHESMNISDLLNATKHIFMSPQMWLIGIIGCLLYLPSSVFLDLWGVPYLQTAYHLTQDQAVNVTGLTFYGWIISGPVIGMISDKIRRRRMPLTCTGFFAAVLLCLVFYVPGIDPSHLGVIFFLIGFCCGAHPLCFALGKENSPIQFSGTAVAVTNMLIMAGGAVFQPVVGELLDFHARHNPLGLDGLRIYTEADYTFALGIVPLGVSLGIFLSLFLKETYCQVRLTEAQERFLNRSQKKAKPPIALSLQGGNPSK